MKDTQILGLGLETRLEKGVQIEFPDHYTEADMDAIWEAVRTVQKFRRLLPKED